MSSTDSERRPDSARPDALREPADPELSIVMPCLNEATTLEACIGKARRFLEKEGVSGEILVADNGSTDGSPDLARRLGARVVSVERRGYGSALHAGILAARGGYVIAGDADDSYDFSALGAFLAQLRAGYDLVMGNRFLGAIHPGAMPWSHRWIGNPTLSALGRLLFRCPVGDFHCGLRGVRREAYRRLELRTTGMEFASEMVIKATLAGLRIVEVPIELRPSPRPRTSHLHTWRDGWRHLRFMLLFSPGWLFLAPASALLGGGAAAFGWLLLGSRRIGSVLLDIHTLLVAGLFCLLGYQLLVFAVFAKVFAVTEGLHPAPNWLERLLRYGTLEVGLACGAGMALTGALALGLAVWDWWSVGFGDLDPRTTMRQVIPGAVLLTLGVETVFASFFLSVLGLRRR